MILCVDDIELLANAGNFDHAITIRAKDTVTDAWIYGNMSNVNRMIEFGYVNYHNIDSKTICRCTYHRDKDETIIYEHDILYNIKYSFGVVRYSEIYGVFFVELSGKRCLSLNEYTNEKDTYIHGNIIDNTDFFKITFDNVRIRITSGDLLLVDAIAKPVSIDTDGYYVVLKKILDGDKLNLYGDALNSGKILFIKREFIV